MVHTVLEPATRKRVPKSRLHGSLFARTGGVQRSHGGKAWIAIFQAFDEGMKKDPNCAPPYAALARLYERGANLGLLKPTDAMPRRGLRRKKRLNSILSNPEAHIYLADALLTVDF